MSDASILVGKGAEQIRLQGRYANRHGLVAGATGTGKTVTLMVLAEGFSRMGVPVFIADAKGDIAGLAAAGSPHPKIDERIETIGIEHYVQEPNPVVLWDLWGDLGHPVRTTVTEIGPVLMARMLELNETQEGVLNVAFRVADENGLLLLDFKDLRALLAHVAEHRKEISGEYGLVSTASIGAIQRALLRLETDGAERFFGEPALALTDLMRQDLSGRGIINVLAAEQLILKPKLYSTFLLWLLSELFEQLPEVGDADTPKLVFFFDEAHLLFDDCPPALQDRVEQVVRLIRSKGVGVYFCSQNPDDVPDEVLGQLGNRVQHALRAFTPRDQKAVRAAAETFVPNPAIDVEQAITTLGVGEALVSMLADKGVPQPVDQALIAPPRCRMGVLSAEERAAVRSRSPIGPKYDQAVDRESAHEMLARQAAAAAEAAARAQAQAEADAQAEASARTSAPRPERRSNRQSAGEAMLKSTLRSIGTTLGRELSRGLLGGLFGKRGR
ncbi:helicase HerA-like domain-containing protein [Wenzhouxiangella sp. XN79A]|uniref:helicase HerA-like domain-containing protein n=1 Tax=Wenzhouxiangella sp. XN79A TaxID=2724193 RepID=UPI003217354B